MQALHNLLKPDRLTAVVDIVADKEAGSPSYQRMLEEGVCNVVTVAVAARDPIQTSEPVDLLKITGVLASQHLDVLGTTPGKVAVQATASFFPTYTFGDIDASLREQGFILHCFADACILPILSRVPVPHPDPHQFAQADAFYIRDIHRPMNWEQWKHLALIAHHVCGSFDLAMYCVEKLVDLGAVPADSEAQYQHMLETLI